jgi:hypothetical protein
MRGESERLLGLTAQVGDPRNDSSVGPMSRRTYAVEVWILSDQCYTFCVDPVSDFYTDQVSSIWVG